jgi:hypothetical protein
MFLPMAKRKMRKVTVLLPDELIRRATRVSRVGLTPTIREGLEVIAAREAYDHLRSLKGKFEFGLSLEELRED